MNTRKLILGLIISFILIVPQIQAQGAKNFDLSARAAALGGAFTARADDASAVYYNPAGLAFLEGIRIKTNILVGNLTATAYDPDTNITHKSNPFRFQGSFFLTWRAAKWLGLGLGGFNPYQAFFRWPWSWPGIGICLKDTLSTYYIRPALALRLTKFLSIGAGIDFVFSNIRLHHVQWYYFFGYSDMYRTRYENRFKLSGRGTGFVLSALLNFGDRLRIGARFQQKTTSKLDGENWILWWRDAVYSNRAGARLSAEDYRPIYIYYGQHLKTAAENISPSELVFGLMWKPFNKLILQLDLERIGWKDVGDLQIDITDESSLLDPSDPTSYGSLYYPYSSYITSMPKRDTWNIRAGLEFRLSETFAVRTGYASTPSNAKDGMLTPASLSLDRRIISLGIGYEGALFSLWSKQKISEISLDLYCQYVLGRAQASLLPGSEFVFDSDHFVIGIGVGLNIQ